MISVGTLIRSVASSWPAGRLRAIARDRSGLGAVEFAIIAPLLLMLYITSFELTIGLSVAKRATRSAGSIADLVTQQKSVNKAYLKTMTNVAAATFAPYRLTGLNLKISGITIDASGAAKIAWSWDQDGGKPYNVGATAIIPANMNTPKSFLVHAELSVSHELLMFMPGLVAPDVRSIRIGRDYYYRPRLDGEIECKDC